MPFGLCNAPATFQRCMAAIFSDYIEHIMEVFMDDFSVYGTSFNHCLRNLHKVLLRCEDTNLILNWEKFHVMVQDGIVLGHEISGKGIEVDKSKVEAVEKIPPPQDIKGIRSFLGHAVFYRRFIRNFPKIIRSLTNLLQKDVRFKFDENCLIYFNILKQALFKDPVIKRPDWRKPFELLCEANNESVGVALCQRDGDELNIIYHASRTLNNAQINYPLIEKEFFAVVFACEKFRSYITDSKVRVYTDCIRLK
jgi:hypothetical protein